MSQLTVTTFQPQIKWQHGGSTATLRITYSGDFTDSQSQEVLRGLYDEVPCTIANKILTVPNFALITTNDALVNPLVTCSARFYDSSSAPREWLFQNFSIPQSLTPSCAIASLFTYNQGSALVSPPRFYLSREEVTALVATMLANLGFGPATDLLLGMVRLRIAAADPADPEVFGTNDPLARDALKIRGVDLDATLAAPANMNVIGYDAVLGKYKPQATAIPALHASSHQNSGLDEIVVTGLSGLLADPQIPLPHAVLHELGGPDQINVAGLSGLLADPQTPASHAATHISGGSDPFTSSQLLEAVIKRIRTSTGPTDLLVGAVADGEFLKRDGSNIVGAPSAGYDTVADEGTPLTQRTTLNFVGAGVTATDSGGVTEVSIPGGAGIGGSTGATDNAVLRADGVGGSTAQGSNLTIPDDAATTEVGYMNVPQNSQSADYTAVAADRGGHLFHPEADNNARTYTIPSNASVPYPIGTVITVVNKRNVLTIAIDTDVLTWSPSGATGSRSLAANGMATALKITATEWLLSGSGLS